MKRHGEKKNKTSEVTGHYPGWVTGLCWASRIAQLVKNPPAMQETLVRFQGQEDPLEKVEKAMAPHSSTLAWKIPWMEEPGRLQSAGLLRVRHD